MTPKTDVEVGGTRRTVALKAIVDTGFDGDICVPLNVAVTLGLELKGTGFMELADGSQRQELVFSGSVQLLGETRAVAILLTNGEEALVGTDLLADCRLTVDFPADKVRLVRKPARPHKGNR